MDDVEDVIDSCISDGEISMISMAGNEGQMTLISNIMDGYEAYAYAIADELNYDYGEYMAYLEPAYPEAIEEILSVGFELLRPIYIAAIKAMAMEVLF